MARLSPTSMPSPWLRPSEISPYRSWRSITWVWSTIFWATIVGQWGCLRSNVESLAGDLLRECFDLTSLPAVVSRAWLVRCLAELGAFPEGIVHGAEAVRIAEMVDHPNSLIHADLGVGLRSLRTRDLSRAIPILERGLDLCRVYNILSLFPDTAAALGCAYACAGHVAEALPLWSRRSRVVPR